MNILIWCIAGLAIALVLIRPKRWPEAIWACAGAVALVLTGGISPGQAIRAMGEGGDVYLFLTGMMMLSELARREGVFDWLAGLALATSRGSARRLFLLIYAVGVLVTTFLSNDATAVVLTPAVFAAVKKAGAKPLPYLFICAFVANAASFLLPISNPANLVLYGSKTPALLPWLRAFLLPSLIAIVSTLALLFWYVRRDLRAPLQAETGGPKLSSGGRRGAYGLLFTAAVITLASAFHLQLGFATFVTGCAVVAFAVRSDWRESGELLRHLSWSVLPLVAGLFVMVRAVEQTGAEAAFASWLHRTGPMVAGIGVALACNLINNLPMGLLAEGAMKTGHVSGMVRNSMLIAVDLGPNLSVTGSLATILWLTALRREGEQVSAWTFLKAGLLVMPIPLVLCLLCQY